MSFFVYIIKTVSSKINKTYVGYTSNLKERINKHNNNKGAKSTKGHKWELVYKKKFISKSDVIVLSLVKSLFKMICIISDLSKILLI